MTLYLPEWRFSDFYLLHHGTQSENFGPGGWNSVFPRQVDKKCQEETCTIKGNATGKGLWVSFCAMAALCQGLLDPSASSSKPPEEANQASQKVDTSADERLWILYLCGD